MHCYRRKDMEDFGDEYYGVVSRVPQGRKYRMPQKRKILARLLPSFEVCRL